MKGTPQSFILFQRKTKKIFFDDYILEFIESNHSITNFQTMTVCLMEQTYK